VSDDDLIVALIDRTVSAWEMRLREWPSSRVRWMADALAELERDGSPAALAVRARLSIMAQREGLL